MDSKTGILTSITIYRVEKQIAVLEALSESVKDYIGEAKARTDKLIKLLEREVDIIGRWSNNAVNLDKKLDYHNL